MKLLCANTLKPDGLILLNCLESFVKFDFSYNMAFVVHS